MGNGYVFVASGLGAGVEFVEALTLVLAANAVAGSRPALKGALQAVGVLAVLILLLSVGVLSVLPMGILHAVIGFLLLLMGVKWLKKAWQRFAGVSPLHDEAAIFHKRRQALEEESTPQREGQLLAFNGVLLEGLEVVVIIVTLGSGARAYGSALAGAFLALIVVGALGFLLRAPLTKVPENWLKAIVGVMLTTFGTFWVGEAVGIHWPGDDAFLPVLAAIYAVMSAGAVYAMKPKHPSQGVVD
ncbi:MAG: hypothetical protein OWS74_05155 [Firmicutes bacterium]|nr:hypothetical protein [Bacillota bacterium]